MAEVADNVFLRCVESKWVRMKSKMVISVLVRE